MLYFVLIGIVGIFVGRAWQKIAYEKEMEDAMSQEPGVIPSCPSCMGTLEHCSAKQEKVNNGIKHVITAKCVECGHIVEQVYLERDSDER